MNCRDAEKQIFAERDSSLEATQRIALADHVAQCASCRGIRANLAAAVESLRSTTQAVVIPDPEREWHTFRRRIRADIGATGRQSARRRWVTPWLALPLGVAAALALSLIVRPPATSSAARNVARTDAVEVSAADGSVVFVDDKSGWVVIWESEAAPQAI